MKIKFFLEGGDGSVYKDLFLTIYLSFFFFKPLMQKSSFQKFFQNTMDSNKYSNFIEKRNGTEFKDLFKLNLCKLPLQRSSFQKLPSNTLDSMANCNILEKRGQSVFKDLFKLNFFLKILEIQINFF